MKRKLMIPVLLLVLGTIVFPTSKLLAQTPAVLDGTPGGNTNGDGNSGSGDGPVVPLDGGLSCILLASAIGYGMKQTKIKVEEEQL